MFNITQVVGDGTSKVLITTDALFEGAIHSVVFDNATGAEADVEFTINGISFTHKVPAGSSALGSTLNLPISTAVNVTAPVNVSVTASYIKQAVDAGAVMTTVQAATDTAISKAAEALASEEAAALSANASQTSAENSLASAGVAQTWAESAASAAGVVDDAVITAVSTWSSSKIVANTVSQDSFTGAADVPSGTVVQRPVTPSAGMLRFNTESAKFEGHDGTEWGNVGGAEYLTSLLDVNSAMTPAEGDLLTHNGTQWVAQGLTVPPAGFGNVVYIKNSQNWTVPAGVTKCYVIVQGGGGGGGSDRSHGGGAGGTAFKIINNLIPGTSHSVIIGAGGSGGNTGTSGGTSSFGSFCSATGGSGAGRYSATVGQGGEGELGDFNVRGNPGSFLTYAPSFTGGGHGGLSLFGGAGIARGSFDGKTVTGLHASPNSGSGGGGTDSASHGSNGGSGLVVIYY